MLGFLRLSSVCPVGERKQAIKRAGGGPARRHWRTRRVRRPIRARRSDHRRPASANCYRPFIHSSLTAVSTKIKQKLPCPSRLITIPFIKYKKIRRFLIGQVELCYVASSIETDCFMKNSFQLLGLGLMEAYESK